MSSSLNPGGLRCLSQRLLQDRERDRLQATCTCTHECCQNREEIVKAVHAARLLYPLQLLLNVALTSLRRAVKIRNTPFGASAVILPILVAELESIHCRSSNAITVPRRCISAYFSEFAAVTIVFAAFLLHLLCHVVVGSVDKFKENRIKEGTDPFSSPTMEVMMSRLFTLSSALTFCIVAFIVFMDVDFISTPSSCAATIRVYLAAEGSQT